MTALLIIIAVLLGYVAYRLILREGVYSLDLMSLSSGKTLVPTSFYNV